MEEEKFGLVMQLVLHISYFPLFEGIRKSPVLCFHMFDLYTTSHLEQNSSLKQEPHKSRSTHINISNVIHSLQHWIAIRYATRQTGFDRSLKFVICYCYPHTSSDI
jgi:hypothetical protein